MLADPLYHDPLDSFTDREQLIQLVEHCLRAAQPGRLRLLAVTGNSGTGDPARAAESVQDAMAAKLLSLRGTSPWPNCA